MFNTLVSLAISFNYIQKKVKLQSQQCFTLQLKTINFYNIYETQFLIFVDLKFGLIAYFKNLHVHNMDCTLSPYFQNK